VNIKTIDIRLINRLIFIGLNCVRLVKKEYAFIVVIKIINKLNRIQIKCQVLLNNNMITIIKYKMLFIEQLNKVV